MTNQKKGILTPDHTALFFKMSTLIQDVSDSPGCSMIIVLSLIINI